MMKTKRQHTLAIMHPDAHQKARNPSIMNYLARIAQDFRDNN
ncbi:hypothetical protein ACP179_14460 [Xenorhabdus stockiae]